MVSVIRGVQHLPASAVHHAVPPPDDGDIPSFSTKRHLLCDTENAMIQNFLFA